MATDSKKILVSGLSEPDLSMILTELSASPSKYWAHHATSAGRGEKPNEIIEYDNGWQIRKRGVADVLGHLQYQEFDLGVLLIYQVNNNDNWVHVDEFMEGVFDEIRDREGQINDLSNIEKEIPEKLLKTKNEKGFDFDEFVKKIEEEHELERIKLQQIKIPEETKQKSEEEILGIISNVKEMKKFYSGYNLVTAKIVLNSIPEAYEKHDSVWGPSAIAKICNLNSTTVGRYLGAFVRAGIVEVQGIRIPHRFYTKK